MCRGNFWAAARGTFLLETQQASLSMIGATLILIPLWMAIRGNSVQAARAFVGAQVALVLIGWFGLQFPMIIDSKIDPVTIPNAAAPDTTLRYLLYALLGGSVIMFRRWAVC